MLYDFNINDSKLFQNFHTAKPHLLSSKTIYSFNRHTLQLWKQPKSETTDESQRVKLCLEREQPYAHGSPHIDL